MHIYILLSSDLFIAVSGVQWKAILGNNAVQMNGLNYFKICYPCTVSQIRVVQKLT